MFSFFKRKKAKPEPQVTQTELTEPLSPAPSQPQADAADASPAVSQEQSTPVQTPVASPAVALDSQAASQAEHRAASESTPTQPEVPQPAPASVPTPEPARVHEPQVQPVPEPVRIPEPEVQPVPQPDPAPAPTPEPEAAAPVVKTSWMARLKQGLSRTGQSLSSLFVGAKVDETLFEELEDALLMADAGVEATEKLITALRARVRKEKISDAAQVKQALCDILTDHLKPLEKSFPLESSKPLVVMIAGVNGAGKTTSIGKLAHTFQEQGAKVLLAAGDTFRAAAREQLIEWGTRNNVSVIAQDGGDPAAVAFDAVHAGRARDMGVVMVDTAGRLPTQLHLMEELKKIKRVIGKADGQAPHEILLVVDGNTGQNAISQIRAFDAALGLTGLVVTKLDGTAKGGTLAAVAACAQGVRPIPVYWIGVGEGMQDLQAFVAREFASALLGMNA